MGMFYFGFPYFGQGLGSIAIIPASISGVEDVSDARYLVWDASGATYWIVDDGRHRYGVSDV